MKTNSTSAREAFLLNNEPVSAHHFQKIACDPNRHVAVEACAGAGKTWVLVSRIVRALLDGAKPHEILAITFTKKAAAEMRQRLNEWLIEFSSQSKHELMQQLQQRGMTEDKANDQAENLRNLYLQILKYGRTVQIRTFHSWFGNLLHAAPLHILQQLNLPVEYNLIEDDKQVLTQLWQPFYEAILGDEQLLDDYQEIIAKYNLAKTQDALKNIFQSRSEFTYADTNNVPEKSVPDASSYNPNFANYEKLSDYIFKNKTNKSYLESAAQELAKLSGKKATTAAEEIITALIEHDWDKLWLALFTKEDKPRDLDKKQLCPSLNLAVALLEEVRQAQLQQNAWQHQQRMVRLSRLFLATYKKFKQENGIIDMQDVEQTAHILLADESHSAWLHERLDAQIKHVLIDEFQDTNPIQWQTLHSWLQSYAGDATAPKTFIVGDPKQSIYRFRRADPKIFTAAAEFLQTGLQGDILYCDHTRRCSQEIINTLNLLFNQVQQQQCFSNFRTHTTEVNKAGKVLALPQIKRPTKENKAEKTLKTTRNKLTTPKEEKAIELDKQECEQAATWIQQCIKAGMPTSEILVLARKNKLLEVMREALNNYGINCQLNEKNTLADVPEVQDIVALIDVLISPQHNISLARALKSPLFLATDTDLVDMVCAMRAESEEENLAWMSWLLQQEDSNVQLWQTWAKTLRRWQQWVQELPTHDALDKILRDGAVIERYATYVPENRRNQTIQRLQDLPKQALDFDGGRYPNAYNWVRAMRTGDSLKIHTKCQPNAVQLMTIHGAKGLQASMVIIIGADTRRPKKESMTLLLDWQGNEECPNKFVFTNNAKELAPSMQSLYAREQTAQEREELNALYVAMTRAKQILVISSVEASQKNETSWWQLIHNTNTVETVELDNDDIPVLDATVSTICKQNVIQNSTIVNKQTDSYKLPTLAPLPDRLQYAKQEAVVSTKQEGQATLGKAMHRVLEWHQSGQQLTDKENIKKALANQYQLSLDDAQEAIMRAQKILNGQAAWAWDSKEIMWQANEVEIVWQGQIKRIDRLVLRKDQKGTNNCWWVLDYKSTIQPQKQENLRLQLQNYRQAIKLIKSSDNVRAAFLTADGDLIEVE